MNFDIFNNDAFSQASMLGAIDKVGFTPQYLQSLHGLIVPKPVRTTGVWIEEREGAPALIQTSARGTEPDASSRQGRTAKNFKSLRLARSERISADEIQNMRPFGNEDELATMADEITSRQTKMKSDMTLTKEAWLLNLVQGKTVDADGTLIYDWAVEFGQTMPAEIDFDLDNPTPAKGALRKKFNDVQRGTLRALKGLGGTNVQIHALFGDQAWDEFISHNEVERTYLNYSAAADLRENTAWRTFSFGGVVCHNYRGTDDNSTVAVGSQKIRFFPVNAGIFQMAFSPSESLDMTNTLGREYYPMIVLDEKRNFFADVELYSYPLPVCTMPSALFSGKMT